MIRVSLRGLAGRKLRALLTAIAIVLGVAMISGTLVLTDTIDKAFDRIFVQSYAGTDAVVSAKSADFGFEGESATAPPIPETVLAQVREVDTVDAAVGNVVEESAVKIIDRDGEPIVKNAPTFGFGLDVSVARFNPLELKAGNWPRGPGEVVIDSGTSEDEGYGVGDRVRIATLAPVKEFEVSGIAQYPGVESLGGATFAVFDLPTAQQLLDREGKLDAISVAAAPGASPEELVADLKQELGSDVEVRTGVEQADEDSGEIGTFVSFIRYFLLTFAAIALFVGAFVIFNTLSITVAQRVRELATLRTLGASRRQVLGSVMLEAFVIGALSSVIGLFLGLALAKGLNALFKALELELPTTGLVFSIRTVIVALLVGVVVTLVAGVAPAVRATRVPPISAVREGATLPPGRLARVWPYVALVLIALAVALLSYSLFADDLDIVGRLLSIGVGVLALFFGVALISPRLVRPLAVAMSPVASWTLLGLSVVFWPLLAVFSLVTRATHDSSISLGHRVRLAVTAVVLSLPYAGAGLGLAIAGTSIGGTIGTVILVFGIVVCAAAAIGLIAVVLGIPTLAVLRRWSRGSIHEAPALGRDQSNDRLARENSRRNPGRTAATAAALMIGIALVTFVSVFVTGMRDSNRDAIERQIRADLIITSEDGYSSFVAGAAGAADSSPSAETVTQVPEEIGRAAGKGVDISGIEPNSILSGYSFEWVEGSDATLGRLGANGALVAEGFAEDNGLTVGESLKVEAPGDKSQMVVVKGIVKPPPFYPLLGAVTIPKDTFDSLFEQQRNRFVFVSVPGEPTEQSKRAIERAVADYPDARVQTRQEWVDKEDAEFQTFLSMLYVLLALSVIVSIFGIINTLVLSVFERTRELGMLRAVGMTRRQVRRMIRQESIITALIGAALGLPLGIFLALLLTRALAQYDVQFKVPTVQLIIFAVVAVVVGVVAAILPARRAARLNVLRALQYE